MLIIIFVNISIYADDSPLNNLYSLYIDKAKNSIIVENSKDNVDMSTVWDSYFSTINKEIEIEIEEIEYQPQNYLNIVDETIIQLEDVSDTELNSSQVDILTLDFEDEISEINSFFNEEIIMETNNNENINKSEINSIKETKIESQNLPLHNDENLNIYSSSIDYSNSNVEESILPNKISFGDKKKIKLDMFLLPSYLVINGDFLHSPTSIFGFGVGVGLKDVITFANQWSLSFKLYYTNNPMLIPTCDFTYNNFRIYLGLGVNYIIKATLLDFAFALGAQYELNNGFEFGIDMTVNSYKYSSSTVGCTNFSILVGKTFSF